MLLSSAGIVAASPSPLAKVFERIVAGDCAKAMKYLNEELAKGDHEVELLAGSMFDEGVCVKRDWDRAVHFFALAHEGGQGAAAARLAAGFADPERGPDIAAALWWGERAGVMGAAGCVISRGAKEDPERFVEELRSWPQQRLAACNYIVGVMATMNAEAKYPGRALARGLNGNIEIRFLPGIPRIDLQTEKTEEQQVSGIVAGNLQGYSRSKSVTQSFEHTVRQVADRALKRYPQPAGINPETVVKVTFVFQIVQ